MKETYGVSGFHSLCKTMNYHYKTVFCIDHTNGRSFFTGMFLWLMQLSDQALYNGRGYGRRMF
ncbi:Uncharacterised protein [Bartonella grahamii]|uniref:Uncharacterized protein n=1 Tax=Bartonella grahamii TaxID=33045 RepID=A0A336NDZ4_BARGR|nr:Uncharacterised protein [Bartonella grahamii]